MPPADPDPYRLAIGARVCEARTAAQLSQSELAKKADIQAQTLSKYERGLLAPSVRSLFAIAKACDVSASWLATGEVSDRGLPAAGAG